jgi:hypothetical protein
VYFSVTNNKNPHAAKISSHTARPLHACMAQYNHGLHIYYNTVSLIIINILIQYMHKNGD